MPQSVFSAPKYKYTCVWLAACAKSPVARLPGFMQVFWLAHLHLILLPKRSCSVDINKTTRLQRRARAGLSPASLLAAGPTD